MAADAFASGPAHRRSAGFGAPASPAVCGQLGLCSGRRRHRCGQDGLSGEPRLQATTRALTRGIVSFGTFPPMCWATSRGCAGGRGQGDGAVSRRGSVRPPAQGLPWESQPADGHVCQAQAQPPLSVVPLGAAFCTMAQCHPSHRKGHGRRAEWTGDRSRAVLVPKARVPSGLDSHPQLTVSSAWL